MTLGRGFGCGVQPDRVPNTMRDNVVIKAGLYPTCLSTANLPPFPPPRPPPPPSPPTQPVGTWSNPVDLSGSLPFDTGTISVRALAGEACWLPGLRQCWQPTPHACHCCRLPTPRCRPLS